ncbi:hypothetical protein AVEN_2230-1 [Araneus ventricosus]|uniref:Uncharacterized protein n=1 Tax=Araneus ventricosus TaxID=182803 RepID=A0A4Y2P6D6_ARAVE|nr:hypothetical protein AVEN_2230-1 [Araneus ventricosus]
MEHFAGVALHAKTLYKKVGIASVCFSEVVDHQNLYVPTDCNAIIKQQSANNINRIHEGRAAFHRSLIKLCIL